MLERLPVDAWHHHYHYQASAQYLWLGETLRRLGRLDESYRAYVKSVFQDHSNREAISGQEGKRIVPPGAPAYASHPESHAAFCAAVGRAVTPATLLHDEAMDAFRAAGYGHAIALLQEAVRQEPGHSDCHFALGKCFFMLHPQTSSAQPLEKAHTHMGEAIRLSHADHDAYHRFASDAHMERGNVFFAREQYDLAIAGFSKALDLFGGNGSARRKRAQAYRAKGNLPLALADEALL